MPSITDDNASEGLGSFFDSIWHAEQGFVYLPTLDRKADAWKKNMFQWPIHRKNIIEFVLGRTAQGLDVYYAPVIFNAAKPIKENVKGSFVVWAEYDGSAPSEWSPETVESTDGTENRSPVPAPTMRIQSSSDAHEHVYWALDHFETDIGWIENTNRSITYGTRADTSGWDINQVLRPPYTQNYKYADTPAVTLAYVSKVSYGRERFSSLKPVQQLVSDAVDTEHLPVVEEVIAKYAWSTDDFKFFMDPSIEEGKRSFALMRLGYIGAEMGLSDTEIYALVENADSRWGKYVNRADRKTRLLDIVNRARTKHPNATTDLTFKGLTNGGTIEQDAQLIYGFQDFLDSNLEIEWAIQDLLERGGLGIVASAPGVGKTQMSIQLAIACALGKPFLDWAPLAPMRITLFSLEMSHVALKQFMTVISGRYSIEELKMLQENLHIVPLGEAIPLDKEAARTFINTVLDQTKPDGVIIDSMGKLTMGKLEEETVRTINHHLAVVRKRYNCFVWLIHHNRKANGDNKEPTSLDDVYGNVYITAEATVVFLLHKKHPTDKNIKLIAVKSRLSPEREPLILNRDEHLFFTIQNPTVTTANFVNIEAGDSDEPNETPGIPGQVFNM